MSKCKKNSTCSSHIVLPISDSIESQWNNGDWFDKVTGSLHIRRIKGSETECKNCIRAAFQTSVWLLWLLYKLGVKPAMKDKL